MMKTDKGLRKLMQRPDSDFLPFGFETKVMNQIFLESEKKKHRAERWGIVLVSAISISMIVGVYLVLRTYVNFTFDFRIRFQPITLETIKPFFFFVYIAFLVLLLLFADAYLRRPKEKVQKS